MEPTKLLEERINRVRSIHIVLVLTSLIGLVMHPFVRSTLHEELVSIRSMLSALNVDDADPPRGADRFDLAYQTYVADRTGAYSMYEGTCFDLGEPKGIKCFAGDLVVDDFHGSSTEDINRDWRDVRHNLSKFFVFWDRYRNAACGGFNTPNKKDAWVLENRSYQELKWTANPNATFGFDPRTYTADSLWDCSSRQDDPDRPAVVKDVCHDKQWASVFVSDLQDGSWFVADTSGLQECPKGAPSVAGYLRHGQNIPWSRVLDAKANAPRVSALLVDLDVLKERHLSSANTPLKDLERLEEFEALSKAQEEKEKSVKILEIDIDVATAERWLPALLIALQLVIAILLAGIDMAELKSPDGSAWRWSSTSALIASVVIVPAATGFRIAGWLTAGLLVLGGVLVLISYRKLRAICF